jgi:hydroxymethylbilane synthase
MENLRGNVGTRLQKLGDQHWNGAIFAAAGLERTGLRPEQAADLDWMLPAPAQGAITVVCRTSDTLSFEACHPLHDFNTGLCTGIERDFLRALSGGCSTPVSALAEIVQERILFTGNICSPDGRKKIEIRNEASISRGEGMGKSAAGELLKKEGAGKIMQNIIHAAR